MIGFALLGAGVIGNIHAHNIALHPDYKLIHVIDPKLERANELSELFGGHPGADINRALEDDDDGVAYSCGSWGRASTR